MSDFLGYNSCTLCARNCKINRENQKGYCKMGDRLFVSRASLHMWEEPCISGEEGSGAVFFTGCSLGCVFCQNFKITKENYGKEISVQRLADIFLSLQDKGANNINLVTPIHFTYHIIKALDLVKHKLYIPIVLNCSGYENIDTLNLYKDYVDIYLPDLKYKYAEISNRYSNAPDYFSVATKAILTMQENVKPISYNDKGIMQSGLIVRHLVLPTHYRDSIEILDWINKNLDKNKYLLSLMSQYTPTKHCESFKDINRRITTYEYEKVLSFAREKNMAGFMQEKSSAKEEYTPQFDLSGI